MKYDPEDPRITAYLFDELEADEKSDFEDQLRRSPELEQLVQQSRATIELLQAELEKGDRLQLNHAQRATVQSTLAGEPGGAIDSPSGRLIPPDKSPRTKFRRLRSPFVGVCAAAAAILILGSILYLRTDYLQHSTRMVAKRDAGDATAVSTPEDAATAAASVKRISRLKDASVASAGAKPARPLTRRGEVSEQPNQRGTHQADFDSLGGLATATPEATPWQETGGPGTIASFENSLSLAISNTQTVPEGEALRGGVRLEYESQEETDTFVFSGGKADVERMKGVIDNLERSRQAGGKKFSELRKQLADGRIDAVRLRELHELQQLTDTPDHGIGPGEGGDKHDLIVENAFLRVTEAPLSTFSIDVDTASYSKVRMFLNEHRQFPRPDAVRIEELVNYFPYEYQPPTDDHPFAAHQAVATCPWNSRHRLVRIAIKGKEISQDRRPASNLVFLLDVSGSMDQPNKLPLLKRGMKMLADQLSENDRVAIVVYAGAAGMVLDSTTGDQKATIVEALDRLNAGGSTNGGAGIQLAYQTALDHFISGGVNRVILCTDGDFNVGTTGTDELVRIVEQHAKGNIFLSVLGFGMGNHNDSMLEQISNKGNGNYAFVDTDNEARKVLVEQMSATLVTIAKDVKIQVEFNPAKVAAYRLVGYENRILAAQDFNDDTKDAGEIGAGHTVTALYEIVPAGQKIDGAPPVDGLKYQTQVQPTEAAESDELLTLKLRYKQPDGDTSQLLTFPLTDTQKTFNNADREFQFAAAVASFGMLLRESKYKGDATFASVLEIATPAASGDESGYRTEFLQLVRKAAELTGESIGERAE